VRYSSISVSQPQVFENRCIQRIVFFGDVASGSSSSVVRRVDKCCRPLYVYPLIGVYFLIATGYSLLFKKASENNATVRTAKVIGSMAIIVLLSCMTYNRCGIWHDGFTLWNDVIKTDPSAVAILIAASLMLPNTIIRRHWDYNQAIDLNPVYAPIYNNRGNAYGALGDNASAIKIMTRRLPSILDMPRLSAIADSL